MGRVRLFLKPCLTTIICWSKQIENCLLIKFIWPLQCRSCWSIDWSISWSSGQHFAHLWCFVEKKVSLASSLLIIPFFILDRWFLLHWLLFHLLVLILLFIICILLFIVQSSLWKLMGIIPVMGAIFTMYCWAKVGIICCENFFLIVTFT